MARCLIIGCGCRGRALASALRASGHVVRGTTRNPDQTAAIEAAGAEAFIGDPDRIGTLVPAFEHVSAVFVLLGSAVGDPPQLAALHSSRLEMLLHKLLDTTARGIVYEASGTVPASMLERGSEAIRAVSACSRIRHALLDAQSSDLGAWLEGSVAALEQVLA